MTHEKHCPFQYDDGDGGCVDCEAIRAAVADERERCAKIADDYIRGTGDIHYWAFVPALIAAAIQEKTL